MPQPEGTWQSMKKPRQAGPCALELFLRYRHMYRTSRIVLSWTTVASYRNRLRRHRRCSLVDHHRPNLPRCTLRRSRMVFCDSHSHRSLLVNSNDVIECMLILLLSACMLANVKRLAGAKDRTALPFSIESQVLFFVEQLLLYGSGHS